MDALANSSSLLRSDGLEALGHSSSSECDRAVAVTGRLPTALAGTLYRNGPGLFERGGVRKRHLLDGDGYVQAITLKDGEASYRTRFVKTEKYRAEQAAGRYLFPTWSTLAPGFFTRNLGNRIRTQAGVAVTLRGDKLYAFDDIGLPYVVRPESLETVGEVSADTANLPSYNAHNRVDGRNGDWIQFGQTHGRYTTAHVSVTGADDQLKSRFQVSLGRSTYLHDFFVTEHYVVFLVHALKFSPTAMLLGRKSFIDCLSWQPAQGNRVIVVERDGGRIVQTAEASPCFMWHALNAYEDGNNIIADFVGYDAPDHFIGAQAEYANIMHGHHGRAEFPGHVRRYCISLESGVLSAEIVAHGYHEFPIIAPNDCAYRHRYGYFARGSVSATNVHNGIARIDFENGALESYDFGPGFHAGEPVYAASGDGSWLLSLVLDGAAKTSFVAVFSADAVAEGPLARINLGCAVPLSFHGCWAPE